MPKTPQEMDEFATAEANELLALPLSERRRRLSGLRGQNEALYSLVKQRMDDVRQQYSSQGKTDLLMANYGQA